MGSYARSSTWRWGRVKWTDQINISHDNSHLYVQFIILFHNSINIIIYSSRNKLQLKPFLLYSYLSITTKYSFTFNTWYAPDLHLACNIGYGTVGFLIPGFLAITPEVFILSIINSPSISWIQNLASGGFKKIVLLILISKITIKWKKYEIVFF